MSSFKIKNIFDRIAVEQNPKEIRAFLRKVGYTLFRAILELIDNIIGAKGHNADVVYDQDNKAIIIRDNGVGIPHEYQKYLVKIGNDEGKPATLLGKNGVGFNLATVLLSDFVRVVTKTVGDDPVVYIPHMSTNEVECRSPILDEGNIEEIEATRLNNCGSGTSIILSDLLISQSRIDALMTELYIKLGRYYHVFMSDRRSQLTIRVTNPKTGGPIKVHPYDWLHLDDAVEKVGQNTIGRVFLIKPETAIILNSSTDAKIEAILTGTYIPTKNYLKAFNREQIAILYPECLRESDHSEEETGGVQIYRGSRKDGYRMMGRISFRDLGMDRGTDKRSLLKSIRFSLMMEANPVVDKEIFDQHVSKTVDPDALSEKFKVSLIATLNEAIKTSKAEEMRKRESEKVPASKKLRKVEHAIEEAFSESVNASTSKMWKKGIAFFKEQLKDQLFKK